MLVGLFVAFAIGCGVMIVVRAPGRSPVLTALRDQSEDIVWVYERVITINGVHGASDIFVGQKTGKLHSVRVHVRYATPAMESLAREYPHAIVGYDEARMQEFLRDASGFAIKAKSHHSTGVA